MHIHAKSLGSCPQLVKISFIDVDADLHELRIWPPILKRNLDFCQFNLSFRRRELGTCVLLDIIPRLYMRLKPILGALTYERHTY